MKNMQTMGAGIGVLALLLAASLMMLLLGCQAPAGPQADSTGTVSLTIGHVGRAIQPDIGLTGFTGGFSAVFARPGHDSVPVVFESGGTTAQVVLPQGTWNLTVNAYIDDVVAATYVRTGIPVGPGFTGVTANLAPIAMGGPGTFTWALTVPDGTTGILQVMTVGADGTIVTAPLPEGGEFNGTPYPTLWEGELELPAGTYFVRFALTHATHGVAFLNSDLHVYLGMTSHVARIFYADDHFSAPVADVNIESAAVTVAAPVTGATPVTTVTGTNFAGTVLWTPADSRFRPETAYTATVTLTANPGHVFASGATATINGQTATVTGSGATVTLTHTFGATGPALEPVIAGWRFTGTTSFNAAVVGPDNVTIRPSSGVQNDARLQFLTQTGSELTPRVLSMMSTGVNVLPAAGVATTPASSGLNDLANNAWWQTDISTTGRTDIAVTWRMRSTNTGPRDWQLQYRAGGTGNWNDVGDIIALPFGPDASTLNAPVQSRFLPSSAEGHDRLYLRWLMASNYSVGTANNGLVVPGGTHQINDLFIRSGFTVSAANEIPRGHPVTVEGFVSGRAMLVDGGFDNANIFVQDGTGPRDGIQVWGGSGSDLSGYVGRWVRVTGNLTAHAGVAASPWNQIQVGAGGITEIEPGTPPTFEPHKVELANIVYPNHNHLFMLVSLGPVRFGHDDDRGSFLTTPGANPPSGTHFVIVEGGHRVELRPSAGTGTYLEGLTTGHYIMITRAFVSWQNGRSAIQLLHAEVESYTP